MARVGGDEFIIAANIKHEDEVSNLLNRINEELAKLEGRTQKPYKIQFSHGTVYKNPDDDTSLRDLMSPAPNLGWTTRAPGEKGPSA